MGFYMILKNTEIVTILKYVCKEVLDFKDIVIEDMEVSIKNYITIEGKVNYYGVATKMKVIAKIECQLNRIMIYTRGIIKYGFISLDFNKILNEYVKDTSYLHVTKEGIVLKNEYIQNITLKEEEIEIELIS
jgi:hypothetical protein